MSNAVSCIIEERSAEKEIVKCRSKANLEQCCWSWTRALCSAMGDSPYIDITVTLSSSSKLLPAAGAKSGQEQAKVANASTAVGGELSIGTKWR